MNLEFKISITILSRKKAWNNGDWWFIWLILQTYRKRVSFMIIFT